MTIPNWRELKPHPTAAIFPTMSDDDYQRLKKDIETNGYDPSHPVILKDGQVLDGRNRLRACIELGIEPPFAEFQGESAADFVMRENLHRRHLTPSQKAAVGVEMRHQYAEEARERQRQGGREKVRVKRPEAVEGGRTRDHAAAQVGISPSHIERAAYIQKWAPDLFEEVKAGKMTVTVAKQKAKERTEGVNGKRPKTITVTPTKVLVAKKPETLELSEIEAQIEDRMATCLEVALALLDIRDRMLYLENYGEFRRYLRERWGIAGRNFTAVLLATDLPELTR